MLTMKEQLTEWIEQSLSHLKTQGILPENLCYPAQLVERSNHANHGDFSSNIALVLAKLVKKHPIVLAKAIEGSQELPAVVDKIEIAPPGFINFFIKKTAFCGIIQTILNEKERFGTSLKGANDRILLEFVSANPTGPLHVGHGRGAAYGASLANLLKAVGCQVHCEYYINDAGRQMDILATSIWLRYLELNGQTFPFPVNAYRGEYVIEIAKMLQKTHPKTLNRDSQTLFTDIPSSEETPEAHLDSLIQNAKKMLGQDYAIPHQLGLQCLLEDIQADLTEFGIQFDTWFSEKTLQQKGVLDKVLERLQHSGYLYEQDGALWFRSSSLGDEKDRVIRKENGEYTYFATDIAYHLNKIERGFNRLIDVLGADHHGYVARIQASLTALGYSKDIFIALLVQFAILYRGRERVQMSSRSGSFVTLRALRNEVGNDAARFFYVMRKCDQHLDFDLELARSTSHENPVYYIQYAHARVCSLERKLQEQNIFFDWTRVGSSLHLLQEPAEETLLQTLARYPEVIESSAFLYQPHWLAHYLQELAGYFHAYYNAHKVLVEDVPLRDARLALCFVVRQVIANGLCLLGVSAPTAM